MKNKLLVMSILFLNLLPLNLIAETPSYPRQIINGTDYYIYTVQASEGLYAISRRFGVTQAEINTANPEIQSGLKVGQVIKVPVRKSVSIDRPQTSEPKSTAIEFIKHKVESKQTLYSISKLYGISQAEIIKYNPQIEKGLQTGVVLQIPQKATTTPLPKKEPVKETLAVQSEPKVEQKPAPKTEKAAEPRYKKHIVQKKETIYSLSKLYGVEPAEIVKLNPLAAKKLKVGMEILIPIIEKNEEKPTAPVSVMELENSSAKSNLQLTGNKKNIKLAFLLPFMLDENSSDVSNERFVDFYAGALLAIDDAKQKGVSFEISTFDTGNTEQKMLEVLSSPFLKNADLIIGPAFTNQVSLMSNFAKENKINTLVPFSSKINDIDSNPYLFQFNPNKEIELGFTLDVLTKKYKNAQILFANLPDISSMDEGFKWVNDLKKELKNRNIKYNQMELSSPDYSDFKSYLKKGVKNIVIFNSDKFAFVSPFLDALVSQSEGVDVVLFEQYNWKSQDKKIATSIVISPFEKSPSSVLPSKFNLKYFQIYGKQPTTFSPRFDLLGYDLVSYFVALMNKYDDDLPKHIDSFEYTSGIQSRPNFKKINPSSGYMNYRLYLNESYNTK